MLFLSKQFWQFFSLNFLLYATLVWLTLNFLNGLKSNPFPWNYFAIYLLIIIPLLFLTYPLLKQNSNWFYKSVIILFGNNLLVFSFGVVSSFFTNSIHPSASLKEGFGFSLAMVFFGQIFIFVNSVIIMVINFSLKKYFNF